MSRIAFFRLSYGFAHEKSYVLAALSRRLRTACYDKCKDDRRSKDGGNEEVIDSESKSSTKNAAKEKLDSLLKEMMKDGPLTKQSPQVSIELAKPKRIKKHKPRSSGSVDSTDTLEENVIQATKTVAESLGGNAKETESELLQKILSTKGTSNISDLIGGMAIDRGDTPKPGRESTKEWVQVRREQGMLGRPKREVDRIRQANFSRGQLSTVDLFGGTRLGIFIGDKGTSKIDKHSPSEPLSVWNKLEEREIRLATLHPPRNYFQQMILWTEQGKLWKFPIDNEQGLEEEKKVFFTEHIFLEKHLEPWCPKKGPIRHFMELVCVGLSKNPYISVEEKKAHIKWYAEYFDAKKDILKEVGALPE